MVCVNVKQQWTRTTAVQSFGRSCVKVWGGRPGLPVPKQSLWSLSADMKQHFKNKKGTAVQHLAKLSVTKRYVLDRFVSAQKFLRLSESLSAARESRSPTSVYTCKTEKQLYTLKIL